MSGWISCIVDRATGWQKVFCGSCRAVMVHMVQESEKRGYINHLFVCPECGRELGFSSSKDVGPATREAAGPAAERAGA